MPGKLSIAMAVIATAMTAHAEPDQQWKPAFEDAGTHDWQANWFLDGGKSTVTNTPGGMILKTGPVADKDASHAVLWTRRNFEGDLRVEYDFTRIDSAVEHPSVCIFYLEATGSGVAPYEADIFAWRDLRRVASMRLYYEHMNCYHFSYACTGGKDGSYVRARHYPTKGDFERDTLVEPSYGNVDIFKPGDTWHLIFEKLGMKLTFTATRGDEKRVFTWDASTFPPVAGGRLGLRQMWGRESRFANFKVFAKK